MKKIILYVHGQGGSAEEAEHYRPLFQGERVIGFDYKAVTPWDAKEEFVPFAESLRKENESVILIANSLGAYFSVHALTEKQIDRAFLISPIVDMEALILNMMARAGVTEEELREKREIPTDFGETLSWHYLRYARENPLNWNVPTRILYGENDSFTPYRTVSAFADKLGARLTVMKNGEHWFHTKEQMAFLDSWIRYV